ncbi:MULTISPECIES: hypothetical protein [Rhizobium]|uniref:Uncharacterized protein n=1 Tax=Rhizobium favelukesii TaxID=348824 RepID=W6RWC9_9HYPH|nr:MULTISPECIES: hypothetical protein [Rhizobium]MCA0802618.1 hypothetical protein [Rhizobium sp. T1473]MCS0457576.1 hypothetical protein [Rhizobium favelukesii]UFS83793.1 hypothetical protein LPB79_16525 [Rhizobium sp. T136]CDM58581.1 hypothetical protein LPU83_2930 [Rhizobium favelukesii]
MQGEAATWHYFVAAGLFALLGAIGHLCRAVFNVLPDRVTDRPLMDLPLSSGYNLPDLLFGTEYDDSGYYRLDSLKNFRISCMLSVVGGLLAMLFSPGVSIAMAWLIERGLSWVWNLLLFRLHTIGLL